MCGRFTLRAPAQKLRDAFPLFEIPDTTPRYNIAPTQQILAVRQEEDAKPRAGFLRWGLIPSWAKDKKISASLINARADSVATKPSFRAAFKRRRCLILADGFYEWSSRLDAPAKKAPKQAYHIHFKDERPFAIAGVWEHWEGENPPIDSCSLITTDANAVLSGFHDRMPVIIETRDYARWLDPSASDPGVLQEMLRPFAPDEMAADAVGPNVNNARHEGADCLANV